MSSPKHCRLRGLAALDQVAQVAQVDQVDQVVGLGWVVRCHRQQTIAGHHDGIVVAVAVVALAAMNAKDDHKLDSRKGSATGVSRIYENVKCACPEVVGTSARFAVTAARRQLLVAGREQSPLSSRVVKSLCPSRCT